MPDFTSGTLPAEDPVVEPALAGDERAFAELVERHRRELHIHCYRMLGSFEEAEDLVQETFLRAWRRRGRFEGGTGFRAWLYRIATNACLDALRSSRRRVPSLHSLAEVPWLQPYPDRLLDELAPSEQERLLLEGFIDAHERADAAAAVALAREDIRVTMPPHPWCFDGLATIKPLLEQGLTEPGEWRLLPTRANRQPAAASYLKAPGDTEFRPFKLDVLRPEGGRIAEITTFDTALFPAFGLPPTL
jgi:RNA polymerase sigma factor (sigma-70 family)